MHLKRPTVISEDFTRWYTRSRVAEREFYWPCYQDYLRTKRNWTEADLRSLDLASDEVMERLADPLAPRPRRGLVVGHVQSGKTANFTGVIAKAIDQGYRLIIVLAGMQEPLRRQTQRRLDMELLGRPNILLDLTELQAQGTAQGEYQDDPLWDEDMFSDLQGSKPRPEIERLTYRSSDFSKYSASSLRFKAPDDPVSLHDESRLFSTHARLAVVKKNKDVLGHLVQALKVNKSSMAELPVLIIDDESDQASVNTAKPSWRTKRDDEELKSTRQERKRINKLLSEMLELLPLAQYVGYTATPFANVFIDPSDNEDIFPQHFIVSLDEPENYMGASSFFDAEDNEEESRWSLSNRGAYIRELHAKTRDDTAEKEELRSALASFLVSGAIKLYRQAKDPSLAKHYRHHTMLIHDAAQRAAHKERAKKVIEVWKTSDWESASGEVLLRSAFEDMRPTLEDRGSPSVPFVDSFEVIKNFIKDVVAKVETFEPAEEKSVENCVIVVNSDTDIERRLDFDRRDTWKVVVGGAMLSRGFTIEGLTVTYFRRLAKAHDTLLQMGRWFGYRPGYGDLVRIYLADKLPFSKNKTVSLYDAFVSIAKSESDFRKQLSIYSGWDGNSPAITPRQVRPFVRQCLPWLKPTAANKMYNARLKMQRENIFSPKGMAFSAPEVKANWKASLGLVKSALEHVEIDDSEHKARRVSAWVGLIAAEGVIKTLRKTKWLDQCFDDIVRPKANYYQHSIESGYLEDFLILFPQLLDVGAGAGTVLVPGVGERTAVKRTRVDGYYGEFTDQSHRAVAQAFIGSAASCSPALVPHWKPAGRGVILAYLIPEQDLLRGTSASRSTESVDPEICTVGLTIYLPGSATAVPGDLGLEFEAIDSSSG